MNGIKTVDINGAQIELTPIGEGDFPTLYAYTVLYQGTRREGRIGVERHMIDNDEFVAASILAHAGIADENVINMTMNQLRLALANSDDPNILGKLALSGV